MWPVFGFFLRTDDAQRHSKMDIALACHAGGRGLNPDTTKDFSAPIFLGTPAMCTLSHFAFCYILQCEKLSPGKQKERTHGKILAVGQNTDIREMYRRWG